MANPINLPLDPTENWSLSKQISQIIANFKSLFAGVGGLAVSTGTFVANGATGVVVAAPGVTAASQILITLKTVGGTPAQAPFEFAITPGVGFTVKAVAGDTSTYNWMVLG